MGVKDILFILFALFAISLMIFYFIPFGTITFSSKTGNYNFSIGNISGDMQFYPNMRFPSNEISYKISDCNLQKQDDMEFAFEIMENLTPLRFYPSNNEEITITCEERNRVDNGLFIAGEGGPTNITVAGNFNVITYGEILLIKESGCEKPNVALHELLHVLGFKHSSNPENIMYNVTSCAEIVGEDMIQLINSLYSIESNPDLAFEEASASMSGRFLSINFTVINVGLKNSEKSRVDFYADKNLIKKVDLESLEIGSGRIITMQNIFVTQLNVDELELSINSTFNEISKENNKLILEIKK